MPRPAIITLIFSLLLSAAACAQKTDSAIVSLQQIKPKYVANIDKKVDKYSSALTIKTEKTLVKLSRWENKIKGLLQKANPAAAARLFDNQLTFTYLLQKLKQGELIEDGYKAKYNGYRDSLTTKISFVQKQQNEIASNYVKSFTKVQKKMCELDTTVANSEAVDKFIKQRKKQLFNESVKYIGNSKYLNKINKEGYYYSENLKNYEAIFSDPSKIEVAAKELLDKIPAFKKFMQTNSLLASIFPQPANYGTPESLVGLQSRSSINDLIQSQINAGGQDAQAQFSANMQQAQSQINQLKDKVLKAGGTNSDMTIPDFKPNGQRTKSFSQRLEKDINLQFEKSNTLMPAITDIGLSLGYKFNDKATAGVGINYKLGMGSIQHIRFTQEGVGLQSYIDWKLKKQIFVTGGFELNYISAFQSFKQLKNFSSWQQSGLIGLTKKIPIASRFLKNTKVQLLYDIFYQSHLPNTQPLIFRMGYTF